MNTALTLNCKRNTRTFKAIHHQEANTWTAKERRRALQAQLLDSLYGLERGFKASGEIKGEISELILKLEAINPTPEPNQVGV